MSDVYNLQVKLDKKIENILRKLANEDHRKLSNYCRVILTNWAMEHEPNLDIKEEDISVPTKKIEKVESSKKTLKRPSKKVNSPSKPVESNMETITLDLDTPKISGQFQLR